MGFMWHFCWLFDIYFQVDAVPFPVLPPFPVAWSICVPLIGQDLVLQIRVSKLNFQASCLTPTWGPVELLYDHQSDSCTNCRKWIGWCGNEHPGR